MLTIAAEHGARIASRRSLVAYTSIIPVHRLDNALAYTMDEEKCSPAQAEPSLEGAVDEALNRDMAEQGLFQTGIGCTLESAFEDMCAVKKMWHKEKGVQGFHLVQSFAAGEVTPELAHQIGLELAEQLLGRKFQAVVSTHLNTGHIHNHLVWNSVSLADGKKYRSNRKSYVTQIRQISDELCRKHSLSIIDTEKSEQVSRPYVQWLAEQEGKPTWKTPIQQDVDAAIAVSLTWKQFLRELEKQGYAFRFDRKYATLILPGNGRTVRFKALGRRYTPASIQYRILYPKPPLPAGKGTPPARRFTLRAGGKPPRKLTGLRALYFSYLYRMGLAPQRKRRPSAAAWEDIRRLDRRIEQMEFVFRYRIQDRGQLAAIRQEKEVAIDALLKERRKLYRQEPGSPQLAALNGRLRELRHTVKLCRDIEIHSVEMEQRMQAARLEEQKRRLKEQEEKKKEARNQEIQGR